MVQTGEVPTVFDYRKYDQRAKQVLDALHKHSLQLKQVNPSGKQVNFKRLTSSVFTAESVSAVAQNKVGNIALSAAAILCPSDEYNILLFDGITGDLLCTLGTCYGYVYSLEFTKDGQFLLCGGADGMISVFDVRLFSYYGFHYYFGLTQQQANEAHQAISTKRLGKPLDGQQQLDNFARFE